MNLKFTNFASSTIANVGGIGTGDTSLDVQPGDGALFPSLAAGEYFYIVGITAAGLREIMKVTARSTDTLTIARAQDGSTARAFDADDVVELRVCAAAFDDIIDEFEGSDSEVYVAALTAAASEVNAVCDGNTATAAEITLVCDGNTATAAEIVKAADGIGSTIPIQKVVSFSGWNMNTTTEKTVAHGLTLSKIAGVRGVILNDAGTAKYCISQYRENNSDTELFIYSIDATNVTLHRYLGGFFDSAEYEAATGMLVIDYID